MNRRTLFGNLLAAGAAFVAAPVVVVEANDAGPYWGNEGRTPPEREYSTVIAEARAEDSDPGWLVWHADGSKTPVRTITLTETDPLRSETELYVNRGPGKIHFLYTKNGAPVQDPEYNRALGGDPFDFESRQQPEMLKIIGGDTSDIPSGGVRANGTPTQRVTWEGDFIPLTSGFDDRTIFELRNVRSGRRLLRERGG